MTLLRRFGRTYLGVTAVAAHLAWLADYLYARATCNPTDALGCLGAGLTLDLGLLAIAGLAGVTLLVLFLDHILERHYADRPAGESR